MFGKAADTTSAAFNCAFASARKHFHHIASARVGLQQGVEFGVGSEYQAVGIAGAGRHPDQLQGIGHNFNITRNRIHVRLDSGGIQSIIAYKTGESKGWPGLLTLLQQKHVFLPPRSSSWLFQPCVGFRRILVSSASLLI
jgi:hypothetical protein